MNDKTAKIKIFKQNLNFGFTKSTFESLQINEKHFLLKFPVYSLTYFYSTI